MLREKFWELPLTELTAEEWEALCDGCGRCCLKKLEDTDSGDLVWTRVVCGYYDQAGSRCGCYRSRTELVPDCLDVRSMDMAQSDWMPPSCAYRLRWLDKPLRPWHPLLAGSRKAMEAAGISVSGKVISEENVHPDGYHEHIIRWIDPQEPDGGS